jgi:phosphopantetheine adenylyltransferase
MFKRIVNIQSQMKTQSETENELRVLIDGLQVKQQRMENLIVSKEEEALMLRREVQMRELDVKNFSLVEASLKQEVK